jgi:hypothetical protein
MIDRMNHPIHSSGSLSVGNPRSAVALRLGLKPIHAVVRQGQLHITTHKVHLIPPLEFAWQTPRREGALG